MSIVPIAPITEDVKNRTRRACVEMTLQMLTRVRESFRQKILKCILVESHHFEHRK